ncbi:MULTISPECIES: hypothetical protein [Pseudomonas]|jgi:hypothetical protein|uniref:hypothetical protein n=1 Tax=Pseudomonas TaxID=286 RepID=UPI000ED5F2D5|nr:MULTISPECIES: hypothetical protein [Pseudomonas]MCT8191232.1 hypothetical protein [Pseudomonas monteilii]RFP99733.1 hypothetical protein D0O09_21220 [Pseudomonas putida]UPL41742.1 hypothetical protein MX621_31185 [Pseudomonas aeruginosa]
MEQALIEFKSKIQAATGRPALDREISCFLNQVETAIAHRQPRIVHMGLCDFQTLDGKAACIEVKF